MLELAGLQQPNYQAGLLQMGTASGLFFGT